MILCRIGVVSQSNKSQDDIDKAMWKIFLLSAQSRSLIAFNVKVLGSIRNKTLIKSKEEMLENT